jgi:outer membrane biosynthesis protein TonB
MATRRIFASLLAVAGSVSLVAIVPGVALASGGSSSSPAPVEEEQTPPVEEEQAPPVEEEQAPVEEEQTPPVEEEQTPPVEEPTNEPDLEDTIPEVTSPGDPTSVPEPGTIFAVGTLAMSAIAMKRRMRR